MTLQRDLKQKATEPAGSPAARRALSHALGGVCMAALAMVSAPGAVRADDGAGKLYLGVGSTSSEYWQEVMWGARQVMDSVGGTVEVFSSDFDGQKSFQNISAILAPGCEGCMFTWFPPSPAFTKVFVERVEGAGGVITTLWNRPEEIHPWDTAAEAWVANLAFDGIDAGYQNGMAMCEALGGEGEIVVLKGIPDNAPAKQREMGLNKALEECPGMTVLDEQIGNWQQSEGQDITRAWLVRYGDRIKGIFAQNDWMAMGAVAALREKGLAGKIPVTGTDGSSDVLELIRTGEILSTMRVHSQIQGAVAAALTYAVRSGDLKLADLTEAQRDFVITQVLVTKDNVDEILNTKPDPAEFTYEAVKANFWANSAGQIPEGVN